MFAVSVCPSICQSVCHAAHHGFAVQKRLNVWVKRSWGPRNIVLVRGPHHPTMRGRRIQCSFRQITLASYFIHHTHTIYRQEFWMLQHNTVFPVWRGEVCLSVCLSAMHIYSASLLKNGRTDQDADWRRRHHDRLWSRSPTNQMQPSPNYIRPLVDTWRIYLTILHV